MTQWEETKLGHDIPVKSVLVENDKHDNFDVPRGNLYTRSWDMLFYEFIHGVCSALRAQWISIAAWGLLSNKIGTIACLHLLCSDWKVIDYFDENVNSL